VYLDTATLIYLVGGAVSAAIILVSVAGFRREAEKPLSKPIEKPVEVPVMKTKEGREVAEVKPQPPIGLDAVAGLREVCLEGLVTGYGCRDFEFSPSFPRGVVSAGFEGKWSCCRLGCGGWGCAYLCTNGKEKAVFKTPKGFEKIIEESWEPPTPLSSHLVNILMEVRSEAENVSKLNHQNIIKLLDYSKNDSLPLLIYEYADYGTLYWQLSNGWKPSMRDVLLIGIQLGDALRYIHSRGLIHGDINPSNIFIKGGIIKLGDFSSIVKLLSSISRSEMPGRPGFRAPEQVFSDIMKRARELGVENRIDVYQLANTLLFLLMGESIDGKDATDEKLVKEKLNKVPNKELRKILAEALDPEPSKRPSAEEFTKILYTIYTKYTKTIKELKNCESQLASIGEIISKYKEIGNRKGEYIKQITELKERLGNLEREINRYERIGKILLEEKGDKIVGIIGKYLKTSSDYDENAQKMIEALDYDKEDLIDAYKLGRELGYSREQLKNIAAAIALKESMKQRDKVIKSIGEDPKEIRMYIAETAVKARKELKERLYEEIYK